MKKIKIVLLCLIFVFVCLVSMFFSGFKTKYLDEITQECKNYNLNQSLVLAIIKAESKFDEKCVSSVNAMGLMQILPSTASWIAQQLNDEDFKESDLFAPSTNIKYGCYYLRYLLNYYNQNEQLTICAYNAGMGTVNKWIKDETIYKNEKLVSIPYKETQNYLKKVNINKKIYSLFIV